MGKKGSSYEDQPKYVLIDDETDCRISEDTLMEILGSNFTQEQVEYVKKELKRLSRSTHYGD